MLDKLNTDDLDLIKLAKDLKVRLADKSKRFYPAARQQFLNYLMQKWQKNQDEPRPSVSGEGHEILRMESTNFADHKDREKRYKSLLKDDLAFFEFKKVIFSWGSSTDQQQEMSTKVSQ